MLLSQSKITFYRLSYRLWNFTILYGASTLYKSTLTRLLTYDTTNICCYKRTEDQQRFYYAIQTLGKMASHALDECFILHHRDICRNQDVWPSRYGFSNLAHLASGDIDQVKLGLVGGLVPSFSDWTFIQSDTYKYFFLFFMMAMVYPIGCANTGDPLWYTVSSYI